MRLPTTSESLISFTRDTGAEKSTEQLRLKANLIKQGYHVVSFATEEADIDPEDVQYTDILLTCMRNPLKESNSNEGAIEQWLDSRKQKLIDAMQK